VGRHEVKIVKAINLLSLLLLTGCAVSQKLSPPQDGKHVKVAVVKPADVDILPMKVIYRSERCRDKILTSTGAISSRDGYHLLTVPFKPEADSNVVSNAVAFDGGGQCGWKLSNIRFQFQFHDMTAFGQDIKKIFLMISSLYLMNMLLPVVMDISYKRRAMFMLRKIIIHY
jgi:hypothetical protein